MNKEQAQLQLVKDNMENSNEKSKCEPCLDGKHEFCWQGDLMLHCGCNCHKPSVEVNYVRIIGTPEEEAEQQRIQDSVVITTASSIPLDRDEGETYNTLGGALLNDLPPQTESEEPFSNMCECSLTHKCPKHNKTESEEWEKEWKEFWALKGEYPLDLERKQNQWLNNLLSSYSQKLVSELKEKIEEKKEWYSGEGNKPIRDVLEDVLNIINNY